MQSFSFSRFLFLCGIWSLLSSGWVHGQPDLSEKIWVHLPRESFLSGERLPLQIQVVDAVFHRPGRLSKLAYADLWNQEGKIVQQLVVPLKEGRGEAGMILDRQLPSGFYQLKVYTRWMAQQPSEEAFQQVLAILNPDEPMPVMDPGQALPLQAPKVRFFPEGGAWAAGVPQQMGVLVQDGYGDGIALRGHIETPRGDTVADFRSNALGLGACSLIPPAGEALFLRLRIPERDTSFRYRLPLASPDDMATSLEIKAEGKLAISYQLPDRGSGQFWLALRKGGALLSGRVPLLIREGRGSLEFPVSALPRGVFTLEVRNLEEELVSQRYAFLQDEASLQLGIGLKDSIFAPRADIAIQLALTDEAGKPSAGKLMVSVAPKVALPGYSSASLSQQWQTAPFLHQLGGSLPPWDQLDPAVRALVLLCQPTMQEERAAPLLPEVYGQSLQGSVLNDQQAPVAQARVCFAIVGKVPFIRFAKTDQAGRFMILLPPLFGVREVVAFAEDGQGRPLKLVWDPLPSSPPAWWPSRPLAIPEGDRTHWQKLRQSQQIQGAFPESPSLARLKERPAFAPFFIKPEKSWLLENYTRFAVEETFSEIVYPVNLRRVEGRRVLRIYNQYTDEVMTGDPLVLVDGIPIRSVPEVLSIKSRSLEKIETVTTRYTLNGEVWDGVLHLVTNEGKGKALSLPPHYQRFPWRFLGTSLDNQLPAVADLPSEEAHQPFFPALLYWNAELKTDQEGKASLHFPAADALGPYEIRISGVGPDRKSVV